MAWPFPRSSFDQVSARTPLHSYHLISPCLSQFLVSCWKVVRNQTYSLRRRSAKTAKKPKSKHLLLGPRKPTTRVKKQVHKIGILQHRNTSEDLAQRRQDEGSLSIAKKEDSHDQLAHETFRYIKVISNTW